MPAVELPDPQVPVGPYVFTGCPQEPAGPEQDGCGDGLPPEPPDPPEPPPWVGADDITDCPKSPAGDPDPCDDTDDPPPPEPPPWAGPDDITDCPKSPTDEPTECGDDGDDGGVEEPEDDGDETEEGGGRSGGGLLAQTGADVGQLLLVGASLTAGGTGIALLARRLRR